MNYYMTADPLGKDCPLHIHGHLTSSSNQRVDGSIRLVDAKQDIDEMAHHPPAALHQAAQYFTTKFSTIQQQLNAFASESQRLEDELTRVHMLRVTDELTQLPSRRALI